MSIGIGISGALLGFWLLFWVGFFVGYVELTAGFWRDVISIVKGYTEIKFLLRLHFYNESDIIIDVIIVWHQRMRGG